jgi:hypothetical protein
MISITHPTGPAATPLHVLTDGHIATFHERGVLRLTQVFPADAAAPMRDEIWRHLASRGVVRDDPATWDIHPSGLARVGSTPAFRGVESRRLFAALDDLAGARGWQRPPAWGHILVTLPRRGDAPWRIPGDGWHWDCAPHDDAYVAFAFMCFSDVAPRGGGTFLVEGSHRLARRFVDAEPQRRTMRHRPLLASFLRSHPWLRALCDDSDQRHEQRTARLMGEHLDDDGVALRVVEATGAPGDVWLCHPSILHRASPNGATTTRMMRAKHIRYRSGIAHSR